MPQIEDLRTNQDDSCLSIFEKLFTPKALIPAIDLSARSTGHTLSTHVNSVLFRVIVTEERNMRAI